MNTKEEIHRLVNRLGDEPAKQALTYPQHLVGEDEKDQELLESPLAARMGPLAISGRSFFAAPPIGLGTIMARQGVRPVRTFDDLLGDFWPNEETADEFVATIRKWRSESGGA
jgi:hypothetical protein